MVAIRSAVAGVFVGGAGRRMGGCAKGMLRAPDGGTIVERWLRVLRDSGIGRVVLVGRRDEYVPLGLETLDDEPPGVGPIGGLAALLRHAGDVPALGLACDMPFVTTATIARLLAAPDAPIVAARQEGRWEPLCARYDGARVLPAARRRIAEGRLSLQPLLTECGAVDVALRDQELRDWDAPEDVR